MGTMHEMTTGRLPGAQAIGAEGGGSGGERGSTPEVAVIVSVAALWVLQLAVWATGAVVGLAAVFAMPSLEGRAQTDDGSASRGEAETRAEAPFSPDGVEGEGGTDRSEPAQERDDIWRFDGFADFGDARVTVSGEPGDGWSESRRSGHAVWVDSRCRLSSDVVEVDDVRTAGTDAEMSERLARSVGKAAFGDVPTRSDPVPATIRLPLAHGGRAVELASVTLQPSAPQPGGASFLVVSARASVQHGRAVVFALACIDTPVSRADALARELVARFRLETSS